MENTPFGIKKILTGIDMVEIKRIKKSLLSPLFLEKHFTKKEKELFLKRKTPAVIAGNFAAKEAFSKALGTGVSGFSLIDVEVLRDEVGAPFFNFYNKAREIVKKDNLRFTLSISNTDTLAIAMVVGYKID